MMTDPDDIIDDLTGELFDAADEIERLREALREISTRNFPEGTATLELRKIARAALAGG